MFFCLSDMRYLIVFFFFSSRRRHTRSLRDWSSDVCSSDLLAVFFRGGLRHPRLDVALVVGCDALQAADRYGLGFFTVVFLDAPSPTGGLAGTVAGAPEY